MLTNMDRKDYRLSAVMYTDIVGFSRMMERDEAGTLQLLSYHNDLVIRIAAAHGGNVIKTIGDAFLIDFKNTVDAVTAAVAIQNELATFNVGRNENPLVLRIGVHLGDIHFFENDALGEGINIASRLQAKCTPGRVCVSQEVYNLIHNKLKLDIVSIGKMELKNITRDVHAWEIRPENVIKAEAQKQVEANEAAAQTVQAQQAPAAAAQASAEAVPGVTADTDFTQLKAWVINATRSRGQRPSGADLRAAFPETPNLDEAVARLEKTGFLAAAKPQNSGIQLKLEGESGMPIINVFGKDFTPQEIGEKIHQEVNKWKDERRSQRHAQRAARHGQKWEEGVDEYEGPENASVKEKVELLERHAHMAKAGFFAHLVSFIGVNGFLYMINSTVGGSFPWHLIPLTAWGIGLISHFFTTKASGRNMRELKRDPDMDRKTFDTLRTYQKNRTSFEVHVASNLMTIGMLHTINVITTPGLMWSYIPAGFILLGIFARFPWHVAMQDKLRKALGGLFGRRDKGTSTVTETIVGAGKTAAAKAQAVIRQATKYRESILKQLRTREMKALPVAQDLEPLLGTYIAQIEELTKRNNELAEVIAANPDHGLQDEIQRLRERLEKAESTPVADQYRSSIAQLEAQKKSHDELREAREILDLRIDGSLGTLKQIELDLARMRTMTSPAGSASVDMLKDRSRELSQYLADFQESYQDLDKELSSRS